MGGNTYGYATATAFGMSTPTGYRPVAVLDVVSDSNCPIYAISVDAVGAQGALWVRNVTSNTQNITVNLKVLYMKNNVVS